MLEVKENCPDDDYLCNNILYSFLLFPFIACLINDKLMSFLSTMTNMIYYKKCQ